MQVNNTFTSLIADLPYPNAKSNSSAQEAKKPVESNIQTMDVKSSQQTNIQDKSLSSNTHNTTHVNLLV